jgi:hypothetical protein
MSGPNAQNGPSSAQAAGGGAGGRGGPWWRWFGLGNGRLGEVNFRLVHSESRRSEIGGLRRLLGYRDYPLPDIMGMTHVLPVGRSGLHVGSSIARLWPGHATNSQGISSNAI